MDTGQEFQLDIGSASNINAPPHLMAARQKTQRPDPVNPANTLSNNRFNNAIFDNVSAEKYYVETDGTRYPKDPFMINYREKKYLNQNKDLEKIHKEYVGEQVLSPTRFYDQIKTCFPLQIFDLIFQFDYGRPKKNKLFEEYDENPTHTDLKVILLKPREIKKISDGNKTSGVGIS